MAPGLPLGTAGFGEATAGLDGGPLAWGLGVSEVAGLALATALSTGLALAVGALAAAVTGALVGGGVVTGVAAPPQAASSSMSAAP